MCELKRISIYNLVKLEDLETITLPSTSLYHISDDPHLMKLTPRVPETALSHFENTRIPRICFGRSIQGCLTAIYQESTRHLVYVYQPDPRYHETLKCYNAFEAVADAYRTGEVWCTESVKLIPIAILTNIQVVGRSRDPKKTYSSSYYKHAYTAHYYHN